MEHLGLLDRVRLDAADVVGSRLVQRGDQAANLLLELGADGHQRLRVALGLEALAECDDLLLQELVLRVQDDVHDVRVDGVLVLLQEPFGVVLHRPGKVPHPERQRVEPLVDEVGLVLEGVVHLGHERLVCRGAQPALLLEQAQDPRPLPHLSRLLDQVEA